MEHEKSNWDKLPSELMVIIMQKLSYCEDYVRLCAVSKSWKSGLSEYEKPLLPPESPILFLAEQVAQGGVLSLDFNDEYEEGLEEGNGDFDDEYRQEDGCVRLDIEDAYEEWYDYRKNSVGNTRGLYRLATGKTCYIDLPEASGKLVLGTNKGWLVTLGIDFQVNLLHPLLRQQIALPPINTLPIEQDHLMPPEKSFHYFIRKVALSSQVERGKYAVVDNDPIIMIIYGIGLDLAFARLGDKEWTHVQVSKSFDDVAYYKGKFYAIDFRGDVVVCDVYDDCSTTGGRASYRVTEIVSCPHKPNGAYDQRYLVESGSAGLWLVVRFCKLKYFKPPHYMRIKYRTTDFLVWEMELKYSENRLETPLCTFIQRNNLGKEALFVGGTTCLSLPCSEYVRPNCIYFTDDTWELYKSRGGGHDMGIFDMESRTIEPHFQGKSIHPISPPLWYV